MKAWSDLVNNPDRKLYSTSRSEYWIENGIRIERFTNGKIEINNCLTPGDDFDRVRGAEMSLFRDYGWDVGMYNICVNNQVIHLRQAQINLDEAKGPKQTFRRQARYDAILEKLEGFEKKFKEAKIKTFIG
jgi:hypothetical protein